jgi:hypothetical protein
VQWPVADGGNGHYYEYVNPAATPSITWTEARAAAAARTFMGVGGHLATLTSDAERLFVFDQYHSVPSPQSWIGGVQAPGAATPAAGWMWVTGEPWGVTDWAPGEPNDWPNTIENGGEQYLSMLNYGGGTDPTRGAWNDNTDRGVPSAYIVEYPVLPEPASAALIGLAAGVLLPRRPRRWRGASAAPWPHPLAVPHSGYTPLALPARM